ncbi:uncharacterized protein LOC144605500 [Rhinoraja longicauda]
MQPRNRPVVFYILFILCNVLLGTNVNAPGKMVSAIANSNGKVSNSSEVAKAATINNTSLEKGSTQNTTSNITTTVAPGSTVAMSTSGPNGSRVSVTPMGSVQTTMLSNVSSHSTPELSTTPTLSSTATDGNVTTTSTPVPRPTQSESMVTSRELSTTDVTQPTTDSLYSVITTSASGSVLPLKKEEIILTICLSTVLGVVILTIVMYNVNKCKQRRAQYLHHPLYADSHEEPGFPNDTLVISGGLYDESRVYNPNMTVEEDDELHVEYPALTSKYSQFKLEFLPEEREVTNQGSSFATFQPET